MSSSQFTKAGTMSLLSDVLAGDPEAAGDDDLVALDYTNYPTIPRRWVQPDYLPLGLPVIYAAKGGTGKGFLMCASAARVVLGLPFPNEDQGLRREAGRVLWTCGVGEDDQFEDMAPRLRAAIAHAVAEFGLDPALATEKGAIRFVHDLSAWRDDSPVTLPADCPRVLAEIAKINKKAVQEGTPPVAMVVADSLSALLSEGYTIDSRQGARKVMAKLSAFARRADVAFPILHHLTKDGKVAGSPAVLDALRLAFIIDRDKVNEDVRTIVRHKSNASEAPPLRYVITGTGSATHAEFVAADDVRQQRIDSAADSLSQRRASALAADTDGAPFRVLRQLQGADGARGRPVYLPGAYARRSEARSAAVSDAGAVLAWKPVPGSAGEAAALQRADGNSCGYAVVPGKRAEASA